MDNKNPLDYFDVFPWNPSFEVGIQEIDEQHQQLVFLLNRLVNTLVNDESISIDDAFTELAEYADFHFVAEEKIWSEHLKDDEWVASHQHNHASFLPQVLELKQQNSDKPYHEVIEDIARFLIRWLAFHIIDEDKRLAIAIQAMQQGDSLDQAKQKAELEIDDSIHLLIDIVLQMYDNLSSRTLNLMRERKARIQAERELKQINKQLEKLSITDQLTGLFNRRHFETVFDSEIRRARRDSKALCLILFDIDFFKKLNDRYGHSVGDQALQKVAALLQDTCRRPADFAFRIGGEEFAIISTGDTINNGIEFAELIRKAIADLNIANEDSEVERRLTISAGIVATIPEQADSLDSLLSVADKQLYQAKANGRNQVSVAN